MYYFRHRDRLARAQRAALQQFGVVTAVDVVFADEPIQLVDAYKHLRIGYDSNGSTEDAWLEAQIPTAREYCEFELGRALATRTMELVTTRFPTIAVDAGVGAAINLPFGPVQSITSVTFLRAQTDSNGVVTDSNGDTVTETVTLPISTYELDTYATPNRLVLAYGKSWPTDAIDRINSVKVRYVAGYVPGVESNGFQVLPRLARSAMLLMLGHLYENREATVTGGLIELPLGVESLLALVPNRERLGMA